MTSLAPWLPTTNGIFLDKYDDDIEALGATMFVTLNGFVVPAYMDVASVGELRAVE